VPKYLIDREEQLLAQLNEIAVSLSFDDNNKTNHVEKLSEYEKVESNLNALWTKIEAIDPEYTSLRSGQPIEWKTIRQLLGSI
jgi:hypothetical protein